MKTKLKQVATFILALLSPFTGSPGAFAISEQWDFNDLLSLRAEVDHARELECGDNEDCRRDYISTYHDGNHHYMALSALEELRFFITEINPEQEFIKLFAVKESYLMGYNTLRPFEMSELYLVWVEESVEDPRYHIYYENGQATTPYVEQIKTNTAESGVHVLMVGKGINWLTKETEVRVDIEGSNLSLSTNNLLHFTLYEPDGNGMIGAAQYGDCINSSDYKPGMSCRAAITYEGNVVYYPVIPETAETQTDESMSAEVVPEPEVPQGSELVAAPPAEQPVTVISVSTDPQEPTPVVEAGEASIASNSLEVPTTGRARCTTKADFPWWFIVLIIAVDAVVLWFVTPGNRKVQNREKKS